MKQEERAEFSVVWWSPEGDQFSELKNVTAGEAVRRATTLINGPASFLGMVQKVIITDGGDCINFEWVRGQGIIFPRREKHEI